MPNEQEEKEPITEKEVLDGCFGCSALGCLPLVLVVVVTIVIAL
jgi:hypothetical protein